MQTKKILAVLTIAITLAACKKTVVEKPKNEAISETMITEVPVNPLSRLVFDWRTVPVGADVGEATRDFSPSEIEFLGRQFKVLSIEKSQGSAAYTEDGFLTAARALKASNPKIAVLYYWNAKICYSNYKAVSTVDQSWLNVAPNATGNMYYKMEIPECRTWWVRNAIAMAANNEVDGIFVDGLTPVYNANPQAAIALLQELRDSLNKLSGEPRLIFYNSSGTKSSAGLVGIANADVTALHPLLELADGAYFESFYWSDLNRNVTTADITHVLKSIQFAATKKKAVIVKAWPKFSFIGSSDYIQTHTYADLVARSRSEISFPLAAFLVAAGRYSYFQYSWGWNHTNATADHGVFIRSAQNSTTVDPAWYKELRLPLGQPLGNAVIIGNIWTRRFAHATVTADLNLKTGSVAWDILNFYPRG